MTANGSAEKKDQCFDTGMDSLIAKPLASEVLSETLLRWLEKCSR